jgi:hypothetical protein
MLATGLLGAARSDPEEVRRVEAQLGDGNLGLAAAMVGLFVLEVDAISALGGGHPTAAPFPDEASRRADAAEQVARFWASHDVPPGLREEVRLACLDTDPNDARTCQRAGTAALERVRVQRERMRTWLLRLAWASAVPFVTGVALVVVDARRRRVR